MRHGTTVWNEKGITQGRSQNRLSQSGKELVAQVSKKFSSNKIDVIIASPLMRTMQTANMMNRYHNVKIIKDKRLIEIDKGIFTGRNRNSLTENEKYLRSINDPICKMETYEQVFERVKLFFDDIKSNCKFKNILVITHGVVAGFLEIIITKKEFDISTKGNIKKFKNAEIKNFEIWI